MENSNIESMEENENKLEKLAMEVVKEDTYKELNSEISAIEKILYSTFTPEQKKLFENHELLAGEQVEFMNNFYYRKGIENRKTGK